MYCLCLIKAQQAKFNVGNIIGFLLDLNFKVSYEYF